jgi:anti-sigma-K factor RskA
MAKINIEEYISSGILETYLLGDLPQEEHTQVETIAAEHPAVKAELDRIELALEQYALMFGTNPPPGTLSNILDQLPQPAVTPSPRPGGKGSLFTAIGFAIVASIAALSFYLNHQGSQQELQQVQTALTDLQIDCDDRSEQINEQNEMIDLLLNPATQSVIMQGTDLAPTAAAQVYVNVNTQQVYLNTGSLPAAAADKSYQLWALVDGQPIDMGIFELNNDNTAPLKAVPFVPGAQTYAVTLEEKGGRPTPNLEQLYVIGNVG